MFLWIAYYIKERTVYQTNKIKIILEIRLGRKLTLIVILEIIQKKQPQKC
jgi:ribosomal 50S subunit-recycling heat shock protein